MKAIKDIMEILQTGTAIRGVVPQELSPSYPIPVRTDTEVVLLSFYYASFGPPPATRNSLYPPNWLATVRSSDGELVDLKKNVPAYYGIDNPPDQPFATYVYDHPWRRRELNEKLLRFFLLFDVMVKEWIHLRPPSLATRLVDESLSEFLLYFKSFSPAPLREVYLKLGRGFYHWIGI